MLGTLFGNWRFRGLIQTYINFERHPELMVDKRFAIRKILLFVLSPYGVV